MSNFSRLLFRQSMTVKSDLSHSGFVAKSVRSIWVPVESLRWLSNQWDLKHNLLSIHVEKIDRLLASIDCVSFICSEKFFTPSLRLRFYVVDR